MCHENCVGWHVAAVSWWPAPFFLLYIGLQFFFSSFSFLSLSLSLFFFFYWSISDLQYYVSGVQNSDLTNVYIHYVASNFFFKIYLFIYLFIHSFIHSFMRETERERQRHRQREKQAPCREPDVGLDPGSPGSRPGLKAALNRWATWAALASSFISKCLLLLCKGRFPKQRFLTGQWIQLLFYCVLTTFSVRQNHFGIYP